MTTASGWSGHDSVRHLLGRIDALRFRVEATIEHRRSVDPAIDDPFLGLYLSDDVITRLLHSQWEPRPHPPADERRAKFRSGSQ